MMQTTTKLICSLLASLAFLIVACDSKDPGVTPDPGTNPSGTKSVAKEIKTFVFSGLSPAVTATIDGTSRSITATVPSGADLTKLVPTITISEKATVSPNTGVSQDFSKEVTYTVTAEDASIQVYKVNVKKEGGTSGITSDQVIYYFSPELKTVNGKTNILKSISAIDAVTGKSIGSFNLGTEIPATASPFIPAYVAGQSGDGNDAYPRLFDNGLLYTIQNKKINAIDTRTGGIKWSATPDDFSATERLEPVISDGVLFACGYLGKHIYAFDAATGVKKWEFSYGETLNTFTVSGGIVYAGFGDSNYSGGLLAVDVATGKEKWSVKTIGVYSNPAVVNGVVYYGDAKKKFFAIDAVTGVKKWEYLTGGLISSSPTVSDGLVYIGSEDRKVYALDAATGVEKWEFAPTGTGSTYGSLAADANNLYHAAYIGSKYSIYALDKKTGSKKWETTATHTSITGFLTVVNSILYFGSDSFDVTTGADKNWGLKYNEKKSPCIVIKGKFYGESNSGMVQ